MKDPHRIRVNKFFSYPTENNIYICYLFAILNNKTKQEIRELYS